MDAYIREVRTRLQQDVKHRLKRPEGALQPEELDHEPLERQVIEEAVPVLHGHTTAFTENNRVCNHSHLLTCSRTIH
jgi:hypothetical protein